MPMAQGRLRRPKSNIGGISLILVFIFKESRGTAARALEEERQEFKRKLASIGICPAGFVWHRKGSGFRCGGGSHVVSFGQLGLTSEDVADLFNSV
jgi:hypothetical protein